MYERPSLELGADAVVRVTTGDAAGSKTLQVTGTNQSPISVATPDPHIAQVWIAKAGQSWLISTDESDLARHLLAGGKPLDSVLNLGAISARFELGHSMFIPTVLADARALPAGVICTLDDRSSDDVLLSMRSTVQPQKTSVPEMIERLVASYRSALGGSTEAMLLVSAGWDSRLETVLLREAIGPTGRLHMLHLYTSDEELEVVAALAEQTRSTLVLADPAYFYHVGLQWGGLLSELQAEATWRPTIPMYSAAVALTTRDLEGVPRFGLVPYALKGRARNDPITDVPPTRGKYRVRAPNDPVLGGAPAAAEVLEQQRLFWDALTRLTEGWPHGARRDHLDWILRYGFSLGHRARTTAGLLSVSPIVFREHFMDFIGLPEDSRVENDLIVTIIRKLSPDLYDIPIISSGGDGNLHSTAVGADVDLSLALATPPTVVKVGDSPLLWAADPDLTPPSPYTDGFTSLSVMSRTRTYGGIPRQLLESGLQRRGNAVVNGYQLATFLDGATNSG